MPWGCSRAKCAEAGRARAETAGLPGPHSVPAAGVGAGLEQTRRTQGGGQRGGWLGQGQLAASLASSCDRDGQAWPGLADGMEPGSAGTSPPVTRDVFIKSKGSV